MTTTNHESATRKRELKRARDKKYYLAHVETIRAKAIEQRRTRNENGKNAEYLNRPEVREHRRLYKEHQRRKAGAIPLQVLQQQAEQRKQAAANRQAEREIARRLFVGPPTPSAAMSAAKFYQWKIRTDPVFYAKELDRAQRYKARTRPGYRDSIVKWADLPVDVQQLKHLQYLINRQVERAQDNEKH